MECRPAPVDHVVFFYDDGAQLSERVVEFAAEGLRADESVVLIATAEHSHDVGVALAARGLDVERVRILDAAETLARFCRDGEIDRAAFDCA